MSTVLYFLRLLVLFATLALGGVILKGVWQSLRFGRLRHTDTSSFTLRKTAPFRFWLIFIILLGFGCLSIIAPIMILFRDYF